MGHQNERVNAEPSVEISASDVDDDLLDEWDLLSEWEYVIEMYLHWNNISKVWYIGIFKVYYAHC